VLSPKGTFVPISARIIETAGMLYFVSMKADS
jgi:hypothetical protein